MSTSYVDYGQTVEDHQSLLVLVRHIGSELPTQGFNITLDKISRVNHIHVQGQKRDVSVRYERTYSVDFNSWGDFQAHRKVLGLISIGKCNDHVEFQDMFDNYRSIKEEYSTTIINSRLIVFGMNTDGSPISSLVDDNGNDAGVEKHPKGEENCGNNCKCSCANNINSSSSNVNALQPLKEQNEGKESEKSDGETCDSCLVNSSKSSPNPVRAEKRRLHSNSLTKESSGAEVVFYPNVENCADLEERIKEFVTSLYYVLEGKRLDRSFERSDKLSLLCAPFERKDYVGVDTDTKSFRKKCMGRLRKHLGDMCLQAAMPGEAILHYNTALDLLRPVNDFLWMGGCYEGLCVASVVLACPKASPLGLRRNLSFQTKRSISITESKSRSGSSYSNGLDMLTETGVQPSVNVEDVLEKYKEAVTYYSKFKNAAMIEMEACLKACRFFILQKKFLQASDFLQNVVYISLPSQEDDRIQRYNTLSALYSQIGFHRKAAFFKRVSGMHCVAPDSSPSWSQCYDLLLQCLSGYSLSVNPKEMERDHAQGWPVLQYRVLHELVYSARRMSNPQIAVRHMSLLIHTMLPYINVSDQREALTGLATLTQKCPGTPQPIALDSGLILPPVSLLSLPTVRSFKLLAPSPHLQANKLERPGDSGASSDVFIYTPLSLGSRKANDSKPDFKWVCGDVCEASLQLSNPLADELKIFYMGLMTSGLETELFPATPIIPPESGLMTVKLMVKPKAVGMLTVLGYTTIVYGVKSNCRLRDLVNLRPSPMSEVEVEVIPPLPQVALSCSLPKSAVFTSGSSGADVVATGSAVLFAGQSTECIVTLQNTSEHPVEMLSVRLSPKNDMQDVLSRVLTWSEENVNSQLPVQPSSHLCFSLCIHGDSDFILPSEIPLRSPMSGSSRSRADSSDNKTVDAVLSLQYSGGPGMEVGYCRQSSLSLNIDVLPSVYLSNWDVQHMESASQCRICLDLMNMSTHQMDIHYGTDKKVILEPQQTRRIGVTVPRIDPALVELGQPQEDRIPAHYRTRLKPNPYSQCLANYIDIRWTMPAAKAHGKVGIDYIKWSEEQLAVLLMSDIRWEAQLNGQFCSPSTRFRFAVGEPLQVTVILENISSDTKTNARLCMSPQQVNVDGDLDRDEGTHAVVGSSTLYLDEVPQGQAVTHSCTFIFFLPGAYHVDICCYHGNRTQIDQQEPQSEMATTSSSLAEESKWMCCLPVKFEIT